MNSESGFLTSNNPAITSLDLQYLFAEFSRLDLLLQRQIARWRAAGQDPGDAFRGLYVSDHEVSALLGRRLGGNWADFAESDESEFARLLITANDQIKAALNTAAAQEKTPRLVQLVKKFGLSEFEKQVILLALAPSLDLRYQRIFGYLQDDVTRKKPSINLSLDLFAHPNERIEALRAFDEDGPLLKYYFLSKFDPEEPILAQLLKIDPKVSHWLLGKYKPCNLHSYPSEGMEKIDYSESFPVYDKQLIISLSGPDQLAQVTAAKAYSIRTEKPLLTMDLGERDNEPEVHSKIDRTLRDALLLGAIPYFTGWDKILEDDAPPARLFKSILDFPDLALISSEKIWRSRNIGRQRAIHQISFPVPSFQQRLNLWRAHLAEHPDLETIDLDHLAGQFALTSGQIRDAYAAANDRAVQCKTEIKTGDLLFAARSHSNPRLGLMARKIEPRYSWEDIILPREQRTILHEITATVRQRPKVLDEWGVGTKLASSRGVTVLFAGPPGTGKTMAAEIMSGDLALDLYRIDLSGVVSKYIGETEKNLEKVFNEASSSNAILFFDEADALFGKRSEVRDAHDRYANLEISYLLQRMEAYDGVTILATNLRANLDEAFTRRLQFAVDFPFPEEEDRFRIWLALLPSELPREQEIDFKLLAKRFRIAGGNIRNVIVNAAYLAANDGGVVTMEHLLHGTRRELQKMGRLLNEEDLLVS